MKEIKNNDPLQPHNNPPKNRFLDPNSEELDKIIDFSPSNIFNG